MRLLFFEKDSTRTLAWYLFMFVISRKSASSYRACWLDACARAWSSVCVRVKVQWLTLIGLRWESAIFYYSTSYVQNYADCRLPTQTCINPSKHLVLVHSFTSLVLLFF